MSTGGDKKEDRRVGNARTLQVNSPFHKNDEGVMHRANAIISDYKHFKMPQNMAVSVKSEDSEARMVRVMSGNERHQSNSSSS